MKDKPKTIQIESSLHRRIRKIKEQTGQSIKRIVKNAITLLEFAEKGK